METDRTYTDDHTSPERFIIDPDGELVSHKQEAQPNNGKEHIQGYVYMSYVGQVGLQIALPLIGCIWFGVELDKRFGTGSRWTLVMIGIGMGISVLSIIEFVKGIITKK